MAMRFSRHSDVVRRMCQTARCCAWIQSPENVQWSVNVEQAVFPEVHGDPTDLLVSWSAPEASLESNIGYQSEDKLVVQIFDEATGQLIARSPVCSSLPPLRCVHLAGERLIQLTTPNATISIRASDIDTDAGP